MIGKSCTIIGTSIEGIVAGRRQYVGDQDRYSVRFFVGGVPYEREFTSGEVSFAGRNANENIVDFRRTA
ncbi:hypothetical protein NKJ71_13620 [Mesorhizobium sp. M0050]|uniref:hypothetical protein n=1 Tax=Mesorhizobium sp. M0050 TaxID=2956861 RepID=UPI00333582E0